LYHAVVGQNTLIKLPAIIDLKNETVSAVLGLSELYPKALKQYELSSCFEITGSNLTVKSVCSAGNYFLVLSLMNGHSGSVYNFQVSVGLQASNFTLTTIPPFAQAVDDGIVVR
jgi:hypothetical protein